MRNKIIRLISDTIAEHTNLRPGSNEYEKLKYGVSIFIYNASKTALLLVISIILGVTRHILFFMVIYGLLRSSALGVHFKSGALCTAWGLISYFGGVYLSLFVPISLPAAVGIFVICFGLLLIYAPSPTVYRPVGPTQYKQLRNANIVKMLVLFAVMVVMGNRVYRSILICAVAAATVNVLPVTYKIFQVRRG